MEPENQSSLPTETSELKPPSPGTSPLLTLPAEESEFKRMMRFIFLGDRGLRAGWSIVIFIPLLLCFGSLLSYLLKILHLTGSKGGFSPQKVLYSELGTVLVLLAAAWVVALIERRSVLDFNLKGPSRLRHFASGLAAGFAALSLLVGALAAGGWLHFGPVALSGSAIFTNALVWGAAFLLVGCFEEGTMRCYLLFTLTRGINFWWAVGLVGAMCAFLLFRIKGEGAWGVYAMALIGLALCLMLYVKKAESAGFWYASWVTSTLFGFGHTGNNGENWIGIFAAGAIGFVFCVSVKLTGSAWWAIGCHAAWDWAETYFYGTADSGNVAQGHLLTSTPAGAPFWSGGADGPEGSVLVLGVILVLLLLVLAIYGRGSRGTQALPALEQPAS